MSGAIRERREAVHSALQPYLTPETLDAAVDYWEQHFAHAVGGTLHRFVTEVCRQAGLAEQRAEMLVALNAAINRTRPPATANETGASSEPLADEQQLRAFEVLFDRILAGIDPLNSEQLRTDLVVTLRGDRFPSTFLTRLRGWVLHRQALRPVVVPIAALGATVNQLYVLMAERIGPVASDQALHRAIHDLREQHGELAGHLADLL
ncbi:MAG: hypothetical protein WD382_01045 [Halofilum sp. (in: g-proteobacteria)]